MTQQGCPIDDRYILVGGRIVDHDLFIEVHEQLADEYRARGLTGHALDVAINNNLAHRLAQILDGTSYH